MKSRKINLWSYSSKSHDHIVALCDKKNVDFIFDFLHLHHPVPQLPRQNFASNCLLQHSWHGLRVALYLAPIKPPSSFINPPLEIGDGSKVRKFSLEYSHFASWQKDWRRCYIAALLVGGQFSGLSQEITVVTGIFSSVSFTKLQIEEHLKKKYRNWL